MRHEEPRPTVPRPAVDVPPPMGRGGREHIYLQNMLKQLAEEYGFRATIEESIAGGRVDLALAKDDARIACEISVTSTPEQEIANVRKCLAAGFNEVVLICSDKKRLTRMKGALRESLTDTEHTQIEFLDPKDFAAYLAEKAIPGPSEGVVRGYRMKVTQTAVGAADAEARRKAIAQVIGRSMKQMQSR